MCQLNKPIKHLERDLVTSAGNTVSKALLSAFHKSHYKQERVIYRLSKKWVFKLR